VSLELPPASSIPGRQAARQKASQAARKGPRISKAALFAAAGTLVLACAAYAAYSLADRPRLDSLSPSIGEPGGEVLLVGRNFGAARRDSWIDVDGIVPTASSYLEWSDGSIRLRLPPSFDSGLLHVVTGRGRSNPRLFMNQARLPLPASGERQGGGPFIASISPDSGAVGSLVTLAGEGFGASREDSELVFSWASYNEGGKPAGDLALPISVSPSESERGYELWSDKEIRARVPDGAISGSVYIASAKGRSNAAFFHVAPAPGTKRYFARTSYSISQSVSLTRIKASGPSELYLWTPLPSDSSSQRLERILERQPEPIVPDYRGTALFRLADLVTGKDRDVKQSFLVQVFAVEAKVDPDQAQARPQDPPAFMAACSGPDQLVPSAAPAVQDLAAKILRGEGRGSWRAARLVWDWLCKNLAWTGRHEHERVLDALVDKSADSYSYAILSCALLRAAGLASIPVAGYLVDSNRRALRHYWVEVFVYGMGWVPLDPILGSGASPGGLAAPWEDRSRYFGGLDARHIAFSRGFTELAPMGPGSKRVSKDRRWSFQSFYEESSGALDAYSSYWGDIEVTGMY
jgi:transglutaminase-like putative cysteine protease